MRYGNGCGLKLPRSVISISAWLGRAWGRVYIDLVGIIKQSSSRASDHDLETYVSYVIDNADLI